MTEAEVCRWVGLPEDSKLRQSVVEGMADIPVPDPDSNSEQLIAFMAFLNCGGEPPRPS